MNQKVNKIELSEKDYQGAPSSMCQGCGHDAISASIRKAFYESSIDPRTVMKLRIRCFPNTGLFMGQSFYSTQLRTYTAPLAHMQPIIYDTYRVSGDGDTSAIGLETSVTWYVES